MDQAVQEGMIQSCQLDHECGFSDGNGINEDPSRSLLDVLSHLAYWECDNDGQAGSCQRDLVRLVQAVQRHLPADHPLAAADFDADSPVLLVRALAHMATIVGDVQVGGSLAARPGVI